MASTDSQTVAAAASALTPAGVEAAHIATMTGWLAAGALLIWGAVIALALYAAYGRSLHSLRRSPLRLVVVGGVVIPTVTLSLVLIYSLDSLTLLRERQSEPTIRIVAERWWWRVQYRLPDGSDIELANELWLPVHETRELLLQSPDVIHAFWVPALAGKVDVIPGQDNRIRLQPTSIGVYGGLCAEYCGSAHAQMAFIVKVVPQPAYRQWLAQQRAPAASPTTPEARAGERLFRHSGCGACHQVRGTEATGVVGPDLTHVASRLSLGASRLAMDKTNLQRLLRDPATVKPGVRMPGFVLLTDAERDQLSAYLLGLQ